MQICSKPSLPFELPKILGLFKCDQQIITSGGRETPYLCTLQNRGLHQNPEPTGR